MARIDKDIYVERSPADTWRVVGDVAGVDRWVPGVDTCDVVGDLRTVTTAAGTITERITSRDDSSRWYEYALQEAPFPFTSHLGRIQVHASGSGTQISYTVEVEPDELAGAFSPGLDAALDQLKTLLESPER